MSSSQKKRQGQQYRQQPVVAKLNQPLSSQRQGPPEEKKSILHTPDYSKEETTRALRLDLNLEAEVRIKARVHGDLTLALMM